MIADGSLEEILRCPRCRGEVGSTDDGVLECARCGLVARRNLGFWDFLLEDAELPVAGGGTLDLLQDEREANELLLSPDQTYAGLSATLARLRTADVGVRSGAVARFNARYAHVHEEVGLRHGDAIVEKINRELEDLGRSPLGGRRALEGGGGHGLYVPGFRRFFDEVAFVDCSLVNLILASRLARETEVDRVTFVRADVTRLPFATRAFDFVHENGVVEHVHDPVKMISEAVRVTKVRGAYACISPNRFSVAPEPHFRVPLFGAWPRALRKPVISRVRGLTSEAGTDLRSLRRLRSYFSEVGAPAHIFFLPRGLRSTARSSLVRKALPVLFASPGIGRVTAWTLNHALLGLMPYHIALASPGAGPHQDPTSEPVERVEDKTSPWWAEHQSRYRFASKLRRGDSILDVACGSGAGLSALRANGPRLAVGADNTVEALGRARAVNGGALFVGADALALPFRDRSFTTVISFETLEHVKDADAFVDELSRILTEDGALILSTPNANFTRPGPAGPRNPFHVREVTSDELRSILGRRFDKVTILGQIVDPEFGVCPYWQRPGVAGDRRFKTVVWKLIRRAPASQRDRLALRLLRQPLFPGDTDFSFTEGSATSAHALVAICSEPLSERQP